MSLVPIPSPGVPLHYGEVGAPLVVVVHDWYGRTPWLEPLSESLARVGFRVVVPDLYNGVCTSDAHEAEDLMAGLDMSTAFDIVDDVIREARIEGSTRVGLFGFSMGGYIALLHAQSGSADAVVAYYATLGVEEDGVIPCPVMLQFAEEDEWAPGAEPEEFIARLTDYGTPVLQHTYVGTKHSFANASAPVFFDANASALAFARSADFLEKQLRD